MPDVDAEVAGREALPSGEQLREAFVDESLTVACPDREVALAVTERLYAASGGDVIHLDHYPVTCDESGAVEWIAVLARKLTYDPEFGWVSAEVACEPDIDLR